VLGHILVEEIERYYDDTLQERIDDTEAEVDAALEEINDEVHAEHEAEINSLRDKHERLVEQFREEIGAVLSMVGSTSTPLLGPSQKRAPRIAIRCSTRRAVMSNRLIASSDIKDDQLRAGRDREIRASRDVRRPHDHSRRRHSRPGRGSQRRAWPEIAIVWPSITRRDAPGAANGEGSGAFDSPAVGRRLVPVRGGHNCPSD
jgi:uncharacterized coiled-coil protein SlyX